MAKALQGFDVALVDTGGIGKSGDCTVDAAFAQQVQGRIGRTIGEILDVVGGAAGKFILRVQAGNLEYAIVIQPAEQSVSFGEEKMVVEKLSHRERVNQKSRVKLLSRCFSQQRKFALKFSKQGVGIACCGQRVTDMFFDDHAFGERAKIQPNHRPLKPDSRRIKNGICIGGGVVET